jgi:GTPase SAR1 family protein
VYPEYIKKVLFLGDRGVGKTSIITKILLGEFYPQLPTIGLEVHPINFQCSAENPLLPQVIHTDVYEYAGGDNILEIDYENVYAVFIFYRNNLAGANLYAVNVPVHINKVFLIRTTHDNIPTNFDNPSGVITVSAQHTTREQFHSLFCNLLA